MIIFCLAFSTKYSPYTIKGLNDKRKVILGLMVKADLFYRIIWYFA